MQDYIGKEIDRYRIVERLGVGGMAVVYKAYDFRLKRDVALKLIRTEEVPPSQYERLMKRFEIEATTQAKFNHPNIVPVYDYGQHKGTPYLVMAYLPSGTLKDHLGAPMDLRDALGIVLPIADALTYAHNQGILHRDVKPSNILFDPAGRPILTDFGIAKILENSGTTLTGTGLGVGTPEYMAPEQWQGKASEVSDQYALGVVLYELLTGQKPFTAETPVAVALKQMNDPIPRPSTLAPGIPEGVERVLFKALARNPQDRYEDINAFKIAVEALLNHSIPKVILNNEEIASLEVNLNEGTTEDIDEDITKDILENVPASNMRIPTDSGKWLSDKKLKKWILPFLLGLIIVIIMFIIGIISIISRMNIDLREVSNSALISGKFTSTLTGMPTTTRTATLAKTITATLTSTLTSAPTETYTITPTFTITATLAPPTITPTEAPTNTSAPKQYAFYMVNACSSPIRFLLHYKNQDEVWVTEGWFEISGDSRTEKLYSTDKTIYYYTETLSGSLYWGGNEYFDFYGTTYGFRAAQISTGGYWHEIVFDCD